MLYNRDKWIKRVFSTGVLPWKARRDLCYRSREISLAVDQTESCNFLKLFKVFSSYLRLRLLPDQWFLPNPQFQVSATARALLFCEVRCRKTLFFLFPAFTEKTLKFWGCRRAWRTKTWDPLRHLVNCRCPLTCHHLCCQKVHLSVPAMPHPRVYLSQS